MERVMGIEPTPSAWKAEVLPLNYTRSTDFSGSALRLAEAITKQPQPVLGASGRTSRPET
jgi:hypothetical protein